MTLELAELKYNANKKPDWNAELALKENKQFTQDVIPKMNKQIAELEVENSKLKLEMKRPTGMTLSQEFGVSQIKEEVDSSGDDELDIHRQLKTFSPRVVSHAFSLS